MDSDIDSEESGESIFVATVTPIQEIIAVERFAASELHVPDDEKLNLLKMAAIRSHEYFELTGKEADPQITETTIQDQFNAASPSSKADFISRIENDPRERRRIFENLRERLRKVPNVIRQRLGLRAIRSTDVGIYDMSKGTTQAWYGIGGDDVEDELGGLF